MKRISKEDFMNIVAGYLAKKFLAALQSIDSEKSYYSYVGNLAEILDWARDFCELHYDKFTETQSHFDIYNGYHNNAVLECMVTSFGRQRLLSFYKQTGLPVDDFVKKYASLQG